MTRELSTHEKELLSEEGIKNSTVCLLSLEDDELPSTYLNVFRRTNSVVTDKELVADVNGFDRDQMISPLDVFVRAGRLALFVDEGKLKMGLYHLSTADLHAAESRAEALASRGAVKVRLVSGALFASHVTGMECAVQNFKVPPADAAAAAPAQPPTTIGEAAGGIGPTTNGIPPDLEQMERYSEDFYMPFQTSHNRAL